MSTTQLFYLATSKTTSTIQAGETVTGWKVGSYGNWTTLKTPTTASTKNIKYDAKKKNVAGSASGWKTISGTSVTIAGTTIQGHATRNYTISGVTQQTSAKVEYQLRGYTIYDKTSALKKQKKMRRRVYNNSTRPYQYRLRYYDSPITTKNYVTYNSGYKYIYFSDTYYRTGYSTPFPTSGHLPHPTGFKFTYSDVRRNLESNTNNSDGRDNTGTYVLSNVRQNVATIELEWEGLTASESREILDVLNPEGAKKYIIVQYRNPETGGIWTKNFIPSDRKIEPYPNGMIKTLSCTLTEV